VKNAKWRHEKKKGEGKFGRGGKRIGTKVGPTQRDLGRGSVLFKKDKTRVTGGGEKLLTRQWDPRHKKKSQKILKQTRGLVKQGGALGGGDGKKKKKSGIWQEECADGLALSGAKEGG